MAHLPPIAAKQDFVNELKASSNRIASTIVSPSGFFSDMGDFLEMAKGGRVWLFGDGESCRINPIHGADLACATANAIENEEKSLDIGGPDVFTHNQLAELAFECLEKEATITHLWDSLRRLAIVVLPWTTPSTIYEPARFFLTAMAMDVVGECHGEHHLRDHFKELVRKEKEKEEEKK